MMTQEQFNFEIQETRVCTICKVDHPVENFYKKSFNQTTGKVWKGLDHRCKSCAVKSLSLTKRLRGAFKSLKPDYCECCNTTSEPLELDHDHKEGSFRGFICKRCNSKIGSLGDTFDLIIASDCDPMYKKYIRLSNMRMGKSSR
tara:strand:+ start:325 stop:756 length:432 start_codon:yes stop_codon:yes gene_type:complete